MCFDQSVDWKLESKLKRVQMQQYIFDFVSRENVLVCQETLKQSNKSYKSVLKKKLT